MNFNTHTYTHSHCVKQKQNKINDPSETVPSEVVRCHWWKTRTVSSRIRRRPIRDGRDSLGKCDWCAENKQQIKSCRYDWNRTLTNNSTRVRSSTSTTMLITCISWDCRWYGIEYLEGRPMPTSRCCCVGQIYIYVHRIFICSMSGMEKRKVEKHSE